MKFLEATKHPRLKRPAPVVVDWAPSFGRELGSERLDDSPASYRVVACLNVWNDRAALEQTAPSWLPHVDAAIAVDGAYAPSQQRSTDGTREYLAAIGARIVDAPCLRQTEKRTMYFSLGQPGDLLFVVDADEMVTGAERLRSLAALDVGWVQLASTLYRRPYGQPRLFRWRPGLVYRGRHHWTYANDALLTTHQYGGAGFEHRVVDGVTITNLRGLGHSSERSSAKARHSTAQLATEAKAQAATHTAMSDRQLGRRESLRICMAALRDDGIAPSRLHTAINRTTPHASLLFTAHDSHFEVPCQYRTTGDRRLFAQAIAEADIVHHHIAFMDRTPITSGRRGVVLHHHGTHFRKHVGPLTTEAKSRNALVLVSNLELLTYAPDAEFLPNVVPVARYRRLVDREHRPSERFRVAHSPSRPEKKGTAEFLRVCERLGKRGYPIQAVLITGMTPHWKSLQEKARCDACFDSFWLGMQCSGLEAAAMGLPVIAGDAEVAKRHVERYGHVPYTFAGDEEHLEHQLIRLMDDAEYCRAEASRVSAHVLEFHDESAVALRYLDLLDHAFGWRSR